MKPFVRVLGAALLAGCATAKTSPPPPEPPIGNPPPPEPEAPVAPSPAPADPSPNPPAPGHVDSENPPAPVAFPTWDSVESGHPKGATNPPYPVLYVAKDTGGCYKAWMGSMQRPPADVQALDGRVYEHAEDMSSATRVQCPEGQPETLLGAWEAWKSKETPEK